MRRLLVLGSVLAAFLFSAAPSFASPTAAHAVVAPVKKKPAKKVALKKKSKTTAKATLKATPKPRY